MVNFKSRWRPTLRNTQERGVRNDKGFICFLPVPIHFNGQDLRYESDIAESEANQKLIVSSPVMYQEIKNAIALIDTLYPMDEKTITQIRDDLKASLPF